MKKILIPQLLLLPVVYLSWYLLYPEHIQWTEARTFFAWTPDYFTLEHSLPGDLPAIAAAFIAQFYKWRMWGSLIQTGFTLTVLLSADLILYRLTKEKNALWMAFIPACLFWYFQIGQDSLVYSVAWSTASILAAGASLLIPRTVRWNVSRITCFRKPVYGYLFAVLIPGSTFYFGYFAHAAHRQQEMAYQAEHWAIAHKWEQIEKEITPERIGRDLHTLNILLLALSETGQLPEKLFHYPLSASDNFCFERNSNPACCRFNSLFFDCLGIPNEAIHQTFQASIQSEKGMTFLGLRLLTDWYLKTRNFPVAEKYMEILGYSTCHSKWLDSRKRLLSSLKNSKETLKTENPFFIGARSFLTDMARLVDLDPQNEKAFHYLLCSLLISKDLDKFGQIFPSYYQNTQKKVLPRHYEEALVMLSSAYPEFLSKYPVRKECIGAYKDFCKLAGEGSLSELMLRNKYGNTLWYYVRFRNM